MLRARLSPCAFPLHIRVYQRPSAVVVLTFVSIRGPFLRPMRSILTDIAWRRLLRLFRIRFYLGAFASLREIFLCLRVFWDLSVS
jgi:hypothetical protein